jgi:hypothetical protein
MMSSDAAGATTVDEERVLKRLVWVAAQRVSRDEKIATAIAKGRVAVLWARSTGSQLTLTAT